MHDVFCLHCDLYYIFILQYFDMSNEVNLMGVKMYCSQIYTLFNLPHVHHPTLWSKFWSLPSLPVGYENNLMVVQIYFSQYSIYCPLAIHGVSPGISQTTFQIWPTPSNYNPKLQLDLQVIDVADEPPRHKEAPHKRPSQKAIKITSNQNNTNLPNRSWRYISCIAFLVVYHIIQ